jgi:hypothetical protein
MSPIVDNLDIVVHEGFEKGLFDLRSLFDIERTIKLAKKGKRTGKARPENCLHEDNGHAHGSLIWFAQDDEGAAVEKIKGILTYQSS